VCAGQVGVGLNGKFVGKGHIDIEVDGSWLMLTKRGYHKCGPGCGRSEEAVGMEPLLKAVRAAEHEAVVLTISLS
jgi:hypothetical protein